MIDVRVNSYIILSDPVMALASSGYTSPVCQGGFLEIAPESKLGLRSLRLRSLRLSFVYIIGAFTVSSHVMRLVCSDCNSRIARYLEERRYIICRCPFGSRVLSKVVSLPNSSVGNTICWGKK